MSLDRVRCEIRISELSQDLCWQQIWTYLIKRSTILQTIKKTWFKQLIRMENNVSQEYFINVNPKEEETNYMPGSNGETSSNTSKFIF